MRNSKMVRLMCLLVLTETAFLTGTESLYIPETNADSTETDPVANRQKRYTDFQDRATAACTGLCMYEERKPYSECFDLCNWNGRSPSPWSQLGKEKTPKVGVFVPDDSTSDSQSNNLYDMMRTGSRSRGRTKTRKSLL